MECFASLTIGGGFTTGTAVSDCGRLSRSYSASKLYRDYRVSTDFQGSRSLYGRALFKIQKWQKISGIHIARAGYHEGNVNSQFAPLELKSSAGQFLSDILQNQPHLFHVAAAKQLEELAADRDDAITRQELSSSDAYSVLHRKIAELKANECQTAAEEVIYMLIVQKFVEINVPMVPRLVSCMQNGTVDTWLPKDEELESIHSPEMLEMIREHISRILGRRGKLNIVDNRMITQIDRLTLGRVYAATIMYGYFLRRAEQRYQLEMNLETIYSYLSDADDVKKHLLHLGESKFSTRTKYLPGKDVDAIPVADPYTSSLVETRSRLGQLRDYIMSFDAESLQRCAMMRTKESVNMVEKHAETLFGRPVIHITADGTTTFANDTALRLTYSSLRRLLLEAVAFGSFLWDVEGYVDSIYTLSDN